MPTPSAMTGSVATLTPISSTTISASQSTDVSASGSSATSTARHDLKAIRHSMATAP